MVTNLVPEISSSNSPVRCHFYHSACGRGARVCFVSLSALFFNRINLQTRQKACNPCCNSSCASLIRGLVNSPRCFELFYPIYVTHFPLYSHVLLLCIFQRFTDVLVDCVGCVCTHCVLSSARSKNLGLLGTVIVVAMIYFKLPCHR